MTNWKTLQNNINRLLGDDASLRYSHVIDLLSQEKWDARVVLSVGWLSFSRPGSMRYIILELASGNRYSLNLEDSNFQILKKQTVFLEEVPGVLRNFLAEL